MRELLTHLGLIKKAGKLIAGRRAVLRNIRRGKLLILAEDLSEKGKKPFRALSQKHGLKLYEFSKKDEIGRALGTRPVGILLIIDTGFAKKLEEAPGEKNIQENRSP